MKVLVTGNNGYIGPVMTRLLKERGHEVRGLDSNYFDGCDFYESPYSADEQIVKDIRNVERKDLDSVEAVIHLAGLSNDPMGEVNPALTEEINHLASARLADLAKEAGVKRFIFASSCSMYGIAPSDRAMTEEDALNPLTAYAKSKVKVEEHLRRLAGGNFHPVYMRNATVYGVSPRLRLDLVVNNLSACAFLTGEIRILSDGTPWRPIVHIEDFSRAFVAALEAPAEAIHDQAFNVGIDEENFQVKDIAAAINERMPECRTMILNETGPDERSYRVSFSKIRKGLPGFVPSWTMKKGVVELLDAYRANGLTMEDFQGARYFRVRWLKELLRTRRLDENLYGKMN